MAGSSSSLATSLGADLIVDYRNKTPAQLTNELVESIKSRGAGTQCITASDCIGEGESSVVLANVLARVNIGVGKKGVVSRLTPIPEGIEERIPEGVELIRTYVGSAFNKDAECTSVLIFPVEAKNACTHLLTVCGKFARELTSALAPLTSNPEPFQPNRVKLMPNGLASVGEGLRMLKEWKVHGEKLVYRIADTPGIQA